MDTVPPPQAQTPADAQTPATPTPEGAPETGASPGETASDGHGGHRKAVAPLMLAALGVVYGDIGTSPLYVMKECFNGHHAVAVTHDNVLGVLSLIFWALLVVVTAKYVTFVMRADNNGEGGILALTTLTMKGKGQAMSPRVKGALIALGLFGASLFYGDGMITPAISVLSAMEGLEVATDTLKPYIIPLTLVVLTFLFMIQRRGTAKVGLLFGPVMFLWFSTLGVLGLTRVVLAPEVLSAFNPIYGLSFFVRNGWHGFVVLGSVFLAVTGAEALYADMGHFGRRPIRLAWFGLVLPALFLNYLGQGAMVLTQPKAATNPFYHLAPSWGLIPLVILSTFATVIASQAVISGAFSLTRQAVQLGYFPRINIVHTSKEEIGQIYIPAINWMLFITVIGLVLGFRSSTNLAAAYGIAVTTTEVITALLLFFAARNIWGWKTITALAVSGIFLTVDLSFFLSNSLKILQGGWFPLLIGAIAFMLLTTWKRGRELLAERLRPGTLPVDLFLPSMERHPPTRVSGTAIFMTGNPDGVPHALLHNLKHNKVLHQRVIFLTVSTQDVPHLEDADRINVEKLNDTFYRVQCRYGFMENPRITKILKLCEPYGLTFDMMSTTFFLGRENLIPSKRKGMAIWREHLFVWMSRNARSASDFFRIPPNRVVELGAQIEL